MYPMSPCAVVRGGAWFMRLQWRSGGRTSLPPAPAYGVPAVADQTGDADGEADANRNVLD